MAEQSERPEQPRLSASKAARLVGDTGARSARSVRSAPEDAQRSARSVRSAPEDAQRSVRSARSAPEDVQRSVRSAPEDVQRSVRSAPEDVQRSVRSAPEGEQRSVPDVGLDGVWSDAEIEALESAVPGDWSEFVRRRLQGEYRVDDFGFDPELTDRVLLALVRPLYRSWFRVEVTGLENVPADSGALIVANHSGVIALDSLMTQVALHDEHPAHRHLRMLGANLVFSTPFIGELARKAGHTLACHPDAERLLTAGELVGVWPEGFKGIGKPFSQRYKLQRFGRGGFVTAAMRTGAPIIPTSIVGAEETYPMVGNSRLLARLLGLPYFPITPTFPWLGPLGMVPLPSKWHIHFGEPIPTDGYPEGSAEDPMVVFNLTDEVREQIQQTLYRLLVARPSAFG